MVGRTFAIFTVSVALAVPAAAQQAHQTQSPLAGDNLEIPDMRDVQRDWGHATVATEAARVVAQIGDLPTASRKLWDAHLSEVTFPVEVRGEAASWFEVVSPLQEVDVSEAGLRSLWGAFPSVILRRDRMTVTCVDDTSMQVDARLVLGGPEEVLPGGSAVLYTLDNVDDCWTAGGVKVVVHDAEIDPLAAIDASPSKAGDMGQWAEHNRALSADYGFRISGRVGEPVSTLDVVRGGDLDGVFDGLATGLVTDSLGVSSNEIGVGGIGHLDCEVAGPCPSNADCARDELCSCDDHGNVVTRDFDRDGCPEQRATYVYDDAGRVKTSHHDWDNDGDADQRCTYDPPCRLRDGDCKKRCAEVRGQ